MSVTNHHKGPRLMKNPPAVVRRQRQIIAARLGIPVAEVNATIKPDDLKILESYDDIAVTITSTSIVSNNGKVIRLEYWVRTIHQPYSVVGDDDKPIEQAYADLLHLINQKIWYEIQEKMK